MDYPIWFVIGIGCFLLSIIAGRVGHLALVKNSQKISGLPSETKARLIRTANAHIKMLKFYLWMLPLSLIIVPILIYIYAPTEHPLHIAIILFLSYVAILHMYWNKKYKIKLLQINQRES